MKQENKGTEGQLTRRDFVKCVAGAFLGAASLSSLGLDKFTATGHARDAVYVCPPCGLVCDKLSFDKPGTCPVCGMTLIVKDAAIAVPAPGGAMRFPNGKFAVQFPFELLANGIFFPVHIADKGPFNFALDTGSFNSIIASEIVGKLGIETGGSRQGTGSGTDFTAAQIPKLDLVLPGDLIASTTRGAAISLAGLSPLIGRPFHGIIGFDVLSRLVVQIDYQNKSLTLFEPTHFEYEGRTASVPFTSWANYDPQIEGQLVIAGKRIPVRIVLDTGAGGTTVTTSVVKANRLTESIKTLQSPDVGAGWRSVG